MSTLATILLRLVARFLRPGLLPPRDDGSF